MLSSLKWNMIIEQQCIDEGGDKISLLPDCILYHILSFLPTKDVVATCSVSKRWQYLWNSVPSLDFDDWILYSSQNNGHPPDITSFTDFAERVLQQRDMSSLKRFRLSCRVCFSPSHVNDWVTTAISKHKARNVDLCLFVDEPFMLPCCVFHSQFIKVLKLEMNCTLMLPSHISFPCLQTLHLCLVTFPSDKSMEMLFSSCPVLEELALLDCEWVNLRSISISLPSLKILIIDDLSYFYIDVLGGCEIKIDCLNLLIFKYIGSLTNDIVVNGLSSSASASAFIHIPFKCPIRVKEIAGRTAKLFEGLKNVSSLRISSRTIESLLIVDNKLDWLPKFENLITLELTSKFENIPSNLFIKFLECLPKLEFLHLHKGENMDMDFFQGRGCQKPISVVPDIFSSLKRVNYHDFDLDTDIWLLKFVLEHARVLEQMKLFWSASSFLDPENQEKVIDHLLAVSRGSDHCVLTFA